MSIQEYPDKSCRLCGGNTEIINPCSSSTFRSCTECDWEVLISESSEISPDGAYEMVLRDRMEKLENRVEELENQL